ncbi:Retrotrans gag domain-containing protein [Abeliophyllum distichum]|uniref:Retrotrans gag domain-containing protein n=1 Tax=Abeliophyllum distichum TaxID=126358 RepID=A0ABD1THE1_9LAMI
MGQVSEGEIQEGIVGEQKSGSEEVEEVEKSVELSINLVVGLTTPRTMKLKGSINRKHETMGYGVITSTGLTIKLEEICRGVTLKLPNMLVEEDFLPLELGSSDVILGMQWLRKLGEDAGRLAKLDDDLYQCRNENQFAGRTRV